MRQRLMIAAMVLISFGAVAQENAPKPRVSDAPLTSEQIAVYRAVLGAYLKGSNRALKLANVTDHICYSATLSFRRNLAATEPAKAHGFESPTRPKLVRWWSSVLGDPYVHF
jgi:hypothetical protein